MIYIFTPLETRLSATHILSISVRYDIIYSAFCQLQQILTERNLVDHVWRRTSYNNNHIYCTAYALRYVSLQEQLYVIYARPWNTTFPAIWCSSRKIFLYYTLHVSCTYIYGISTIVNDDGASGEGYC